MPTAIPTTEQKQIAKAIKLELARRKMPRKQLIDQTKLSLSAINKALAGQFSESTLIRLEDALGRSFRNGIGANGSAEQAPADIGGYLRVSVEHYIGSYLCIRPTIKKPGSIYSYAMDVTWDRAESCLVFQERERLDAKHSHRGQFWIPGASPYLFLVSRGKGWLRSSAVCHLDAANEMRGILTMLHIPTGMQSLPTATPVVYIKRDSFKGDMLGVVPPSAPQFKRYSASLRDMIANEEIQLVRP